MHSCLSVAKHISRQATSLWILSDATGNIRVWKFISQACDLRLLITSLCRLQQKDHLKVEASWSCKAFLANLGYTVSSGPTWAREEA